MPRLAVVGGQLSELARSIEEYLQAKRADGVKRSVIEASYGYSLRASLLPWCLDNGIEAPTALDQVVINRWAVYLEDVGGPRGKLADATRWTYRKAANQYLAWLQGHEAARLKLGKPPARRVVPLERSEMLSLERAALAMGQERNAVIIRLLADTGMRAPGELLRLRGGDVQRNSRRCWVHVRGKDTPRDNDERDVSIQPELYKRLRRFAGRDEEPLFMGLRRDPATKMREPLTDSGLQQMIRSTAVESGLTKKVTPYVFRHSACRWMLRDLRLSTVEVERILGHGSDRMIREVYSNITEDEAGERLVAAIRRSEE